MSLRERKKGKREKRIMKAAFNLFEKQGYADTTMAQIAKKADLAVGTLYNYFKSKDELFIAMVKDDLENSLKPTLLEFESCNSLTEIILLSIASFIDILGNYEKKIWRDFYAAAMNAKHNVHSNVFSLDWLLIEKLISVVTHLQTEGCINKDLNPETIAMTYMGSLTFGYMFYMFDEDMDVEGLKLQLKGQFEIIEHGLNSNL